MNVTKMPSEEEIKQSGNPLLSRPVTAGSLIPKGYVNAGLQVDLSRPSTGKSHYSVISRHSAVVKFTPPNTAPRPPTYSENRLVLPSRPVSQGQVLQPSVSAPRLHTAEGEIPQRPLTRGSIGTRNGAGKAEEGLEERLKTRESGRKVEIRDRSDHPPLYPTLQPVPQESTLASPSQVLQLDQSSQALAPPQPELVEASTGEESNDLPPEAPSRPQTATTWKTTSSQRRYIDELERLLIEERKVKTT